MRYNRKRKRMKSIVRHSLLYIAICFLIISCSDDIDTSQANSFRANPVLTSSLAFFDETAEVFILDPGVLNVITDTIGIDVFDDPFVVNNLIRAEFLFETTNSIDRAFQARVEFFDANFNLQETFTINVPRSPNNQNVITNQQEIFEGQDLMSLTASTRVVFTLILEEDTNLPPVDENTPGRLSLRSQGTFFLDIDAI